MKLLTAFLFLLSIVTWNIAMNHHPPTLEFFTIWIVSAVACLACGIYCLRRNLLLGWLCIAAAFVQTALVVVPPLLHARI
jgi:hypothetical protein